MSTRVGPPVIHFQHNASVTITACKRIIRGSFATTLEKEQVTCPLCKGRMQAMARYDAGINSGQFQAKPKKDIRPFSR